MEILIFAIWFCLVWTIPLAFAFTAYISVVNGRKLLYVVSSTIVALLAFILLSEMMFRPMFAGFFSGTRSEPNSEGSDQLGRLLYFVMVLGYAVFVWLMCSVIYGKAIIPGRRKTRPVNVDEND